MPVNSGYNTRQHARLPPNFLGVDARMTSELTTDLIRKLRGSLMCLAYFLTSRKDGRDAPDIKELNSAVYTFL